MQGAQSADRRLSRLAGILAIASLCAAIGLSLADGVLYATYMTSNHDAPILMLKTWVTDFRYLAEQGTFSSILLFVGARFLETRTVLSVAFDRLDSARMSVRGPDEDNIVWIGRAYGTRMEADSVVASLASRLQDSATSS